MATGTSEIVEQFKAEAARTGAVVYEAEGAEDARNCVLALAQGHDVRRVVKSRSVVAEETGLREHLENAGIEVRETDLGEWIAQLARETSATHKTIQQVAELLSRATGEELKPDPQVLLEAARRTLRQACVEADLGISEASIGIAETGTSVILDDEGNARLVAVLPRLHLTLVACEKVLPSLDDATARLRALGKDSTGPKMPSYVTYVTGRNTTGDIPQALMARAQGPEEEHILLVR